MNHRLSNLSHISISLNDSEMANSADETEKRRQLKKYRVFYDLNEPEAPGPEAYFEDIRALGEHNFDDYRSNITIESRQKP